MLNSNRRGTLALYFILGLLALILIVTGAVTPPVGALMLTLYGLFVLATSSQWTRPNTISHMARRPRITEAARVASARVASRSVLAAEYELQDIGLVIDERRRDGVMLRHGRFLSKDEEAIRPYIVVQSYERHNARPVIVRFEIQDADTKKQFVYEMEYFLQPGENLILPDYRLPLKGNEKLSSFGNWDLRVQINDHAVGLHRFNMLPPLAERMRQQAVNDGEVPSRLMLEEESEEALPLSLEELLSKHSR